MTMTPSAAAATRAFRCKAGVGSAVLNACRQVGGSTGIALMGAIMASRLTTPPTPASFMDGFERALIVASAIALPARSSPPFSSVRKTVPGRRERRCARRGSVSRPRRLPAEERRRAIVQAALRVFSSGSYAGSTTAEIAREAGVSEPVLYRHFPSKRDLWAACLDAAWDEFRSGFDGVVDEMLEAGSIEVGAPGRAGRGGLLVTPSVARWKKALMPNLWIQGITEAGEDREIRKHIARHMRVAHDHVAAALRRGQETERSPPTETRTSRHG